MRAFTSRAASFFTSRSASALVLYAASWMVQIPRGAFFADALTLSARRPRAAGSATGSGDSFRAADTADAFRDVDTADNGSSTFATGVGALDALVVPGALDALVVPGALDAFVVPVAALPAVRGVGVALAGCGAPRDAPAGVTFVVDDAIAAGAADCDVLAVAVEQ